MRHVLVSVVLMLLPRCMLCVGCSQPHSASARELRRIVMESLEALFDLGLPLPAAIVSMHMEGIDTMMHRLVDVSVGADSRRLILLSVC